MRRNSPPPAPVAPHPKWLNAAGLAAGLALPTRTRVAVATVPTVATVAASQALRGQHRFPRDDLANVPGIGVHLATVPELHALPGIGVDLAFPGIGVDLALPGIGEQWPRTSASSIYTE